MTRGTGLGLVSREETLPDKWVQCHACGRNSMRPGSIIGTGTTPAGGRAAWREGKIMLVLGPQAMRVVVSLKGSWVLGFRTQLRPRLSVCLFLVRTHNQGWKGDVHSVFTTFPQPDPNLVRIEPLRVEHRPMDASSAKGRDAPQPRSSLVPNRLGSGVARPMERKGRKGMRGTDSEARMVRYLEGGR